MSVDDGCLDEGGGGGGLGVGGGGGGRRGGSLAIAASGDELMDGFSYCDSRLLVVLFSFLAFTLCLDMN